MHRDPRPAVRHAADLHRKGLRPGQQLHDVHARPECVRLEIWARAVRLAPFFAAKGDAIGCPPASLLEGLRDQTIFIGRSRKFGRGRCEAEIGLLLQENRKKTANVHARVRANAALCTQSSPRGRVEEDPRRQAARSRLPPGLGLLIVDSKSVGREELQVPSADQEALPFGAKELQASSNERWESLSRIESLSSLDS